MTSPLTLEIQCAYRLTPSQAKLLELLLNERFVSVTMIEDEHRIVTDARVTIHKLRRKLGLHGIKIETLRSSGYWLPKEAKKAIAETCGLPIAA